MKYLNGYAPPFLSFGRLPRLIQGIYDMNVTGLKFEKYANDSSNFVDVVPFSAFAQALKSIYNSTQLVVSSVLQGEADDARYIILTLADGTSTTLPVSKKANVGDKVDTMYVGQTHEDEFIVCTSMHEQSVF